MLRKTLYRFFTKNNEALFWSDLKRGELEEAINQNDYERTTIRSIKTKAPGSLKIMTLPHLNSFPDEAAYETISSTLIDKTVLFDFDPTKLLHTSRSNYSKEYEKRYNFAPSSVFPNHIVSFLPLAEPVMKSKIMSYLVLKDFHEEMPLEVISKAVLDKLFMNQDKDFINPNVYSLFMYLLLNSKTEFNIGFGGMMESLFRAKISILTKKSALMNSYICFLKFMHENFEVNKIDKNPKHFGPKELTLARFKLNTQQLKARYLKVYAEQLIRSTGKDVVIISDPFLRKQFDSIEFIEDFKVKTEKEFGDSEKMAKINSDYDQKMKNVFKSLGPIEEENIKKKIEEEKKKAVEIEEDLERSPMKDFCMFTFEELADLPEITDRREVADMIFKMAFWDVVHDTNFYESKFIKNKFYYLSGSSERFSKETVADFERQFNLSYSVLSKIKQEIIGKISVCEKPMESQQVFDILKKETTLDFEGTAVEASI